MPQKMAATNFKQFLGTVNEFQLGMAHDGRLKPSKKSIFKFIPLNSQLTQPQTFK